MKPSADEFVVRRPLSRYGLAVLSVGIALGVALLLEHFHFRVPSALLLMLAIAIASWYGGQGPGVLAAILSTVAYYWYFVEPVRTVYIYSFEIPHFVTFVAFAVLLLWFGAVRRRVEAGLRERAALLDLTHDTVFVMDMDGMIKYWNRGAEERYGWTAEQAVGRFVHGLLKTVFPAPIEELKAEIMRTGRWEGELRHTRKDGTQVVVASRWSLERDEQGAPLAILETNNDVTERKRAEEALRRLNRELRAISNCNQTLLRATDEQSLLNEICRIACEEAGYKMAWVGYAEHDEARTVRPVAWAGAEAEYLATAGFTWADTERGRGQTGTAIRSGNTCCIQDFATDPRLAPWREDLLERGFCSGIAVPLKDEEGHAFGSLTIHSAQPNAFTPEEIRLLEELAGDMAFGIVNLRSQAARRRAEQELTLLSFALDHVRESAFLIDDSGRYQYVNEEGCRVLGYTRTQLLDMSVADIDPDFPAERWADHWHDLREHRSLSFESRHRTRDGRIFPVEISANYFEYGGRAYNLGLVRDISERKKAEEERTARVWFLESMDRINRAMQGTNDLEQVMRDAIDAMLSIFDSDRAFLYYPCDPDAPSFEVVMERTRPGYPEARGVVSMTPDTARGFQIMRASSGVVTFGPGCDYPLIGDFTKRSGHKSSIGIALYPKTGMPWVLAMHQCSYPRVWTQDERKLLEEIARRLEDALSILMANRRLRESEERLRLAVSAAQLGIFEWDAASDTARWENERMFEIFGRTHAEGSLSLHEFRTEVMEPEDRPAFDQALAEAMLPGRFLSVACRMRRRNDGQQRWVEFCGRFELAPDGSPKRHIGILADITERKRAEEELRESETRFRTFVDHAGDALFVLDFEQGTIVDVNRQACESLGYARQELIGTSPLAFHLDSHQEEMESTAVRAAAGETVFDRHLHRRKDGSTFPVEVHTSLVSYGERRFLLKIARDITDRVRTEEALRESEERLRLTLEATQIGAFDWDVAHDVWYASPTYYTALGYKPREGPGDRAEWVERLHPEDRDRFKRLTHDILTGEIDRYEYEARLRHADGSYRWAQVNALGIEHDSDGKVCRILGVRIDITERKRAEEALRRAEGYLAEAQRLTHTGAWATDAVPEPLYWSEELFRLYGLDSQQGFPTHEQAVQRVHPEDRDRYVQAFHRVIHQKVDSDVEFRTVLPDGAIRYLYGLGHPILNANGDVDEVVGTTVDITERKRADQERARLRQLEADLAHIDRVSLLGELTASISHELNQPIAASIMNASLALHWLERDPPNLAQARRRTEQVIEVGTLASEIIDRLRSLYKKEPPNREPLTVNEVIGEMVGLLRGEATRYAVSVRADLAHNLPIVIADRVQIQQVLMNLMLNGIEAMSDTGGVLTVKSQLNENGQIEISVNDTGPGLPPGKAGQIFDAFFTTKPQGSGMGLAISKSIVESHGGRIWANGNGGRGATFHFTLPVAPAEASLPADVA